MNNTPRLLWLVYERPPHADAVSYPARKDDVRLAVELLESPYVRRRHVAEQLRNFLATQARRSPLERQRVPCRRASGWYQLVSWRLAKWLAAVLPARDSIAAATARRLRDWLTRGDSAVVLDPTRETRNPQATPRLTPFRVTRSL